ncbi:putative uncharacterized protein [Prevotella sp. CAG:617]|nr:putative uncharacterized protein [Prevotella sp. CAG:617]
MFFPVFFSTARRPAEKNGKNPLREATLHKKQKKNRKKTRLHQPQTVNLQPIQTVGKRQDTGQTRPHLTAPEKNRQKTGNTYTRKKRTDMKRYIIIGTLTAAVVLTLVFTCPGKKAHQAAIRDLITETLDEEPPEIIPQELLPVWNVLGSLAAGQLIDVLLDSQLEVRNYAIFSIGRIQLPDEKKTVSFGILGKIYTFDKEDIQKSWRKINQSGY